MNILYVTNSGKWGGMEQHVLDLVKGMKKRDHNIYVWCPEGEITYEYTDAGAEVFHNSIKTDIDPLYIKKLANFIKEKKIDILHAHELKAGANAVIAGKLGGAKGVISHIHTPISEWRFESPIKKLLSKFNSTMYSIEISLFGDAEIALTQSRKRVKMREGMLPNKLVIIPNALDADKYDISDSAVEKSRAEIRNRYGIPLDSYVMGLMGRISEEKGHEIAVRAFHKYLNTEKKVDKKHNKLHMLIAGGGRLEPFIKKLVNDLNITDKVTMTGIYKQEDLPKNFSAIDMLLFPTLAEGFGIVLTEAMYFSLPVISSDLPVLKEVAGETAVYFKTGDYMDLADKIKYTFDLGLHEKKNTQGRQRIESIFSMDKFLSSYENLYKHFLNKNS